MQMQWFGAGLLLLASAAAAQPQPATRSDQDLARQVADPLAALISVPFQNNLDFGVGPKEAINNTLNIQPVIPFQLGGGYSVITRTILPLSYHGSAADGDDDASGLGDTNLSLFFRRENAGGGPVFGFGPIVRLPTATDSQLGNRRWGAGPTAVVVQHAGPWTFGVLASHVWSLGASPSRPEVNFSFVQPFVARDFGGGFTLTAASETSYDWVDQNWVVPFNLTASQIVRIGQTPASLFAGPRIYLQRPSGGPDWGLRFGVQLLFPT